MNTVGRRIVLGLLLCGCLALLVSGTIVPDAVGERDGIGTAVVAADADESENETVRHQNPDEYGEDDDLDGVQGWLERQLSGQLEESTLELSQGEYDAARQIIDEEYRSQFDQLVDVDGETGNYGTDDEDDDEPSPDEVFEEVRNDQERLADLLETFDETHDAYDEAVDEGDDESARELARDLEALAEEIEELSDDIVVKFERLTDSTSADLSESAESTTETNQRVQDEQTVIRVEQFEETDLTVEPKQQSASVLDPLEMNGTLTTADGTPISNDEVTLEVGAETQRVQTDGDGEFELQYRPVDQPLSMDELTVRYLPDRGAPYLGTETDVPISIEQVEPTITALETSPETAYNETIAVTGELAADDVPIDGVSLEVTLDDHHLGEVDVEDGSFNGTVETPATVPEGDHDLTVELTFEAQALSSTNETAPITVLESETALSVGHSDGDDGEVHVEGALETETGDGVPDQSIQIVVDGESVTTATTGVDGQFTETVAIPDGNDEDVEITAIYEGSETNLAPAEATTTATLASTTTTGPSSTVIIGGALVVTGVLLASGGWWYLRRRTPPLAGETVTDDDGTVETNVDESTPGASPDLLLEQASTFLSAGRTNMAIQTGYAAVRRALRPEIEDDRTLTHWEFFQRYRGQQADELREVTEAYERAAFTPDTISERDATSALERVNRLCGLEITAVAEVADD